MGWGGGWGRGGSCSSFIWEKRSGDPWARGDLIGYAVSPSEDWLVTEEALASL